jgi:hypothetical protein
MQISATKEVEFGNELAGAMERLRGALTELLACIEADPAVPYAVSRQLQINKNLAWKVCRIVTTIEPFSAVELLPGAQGMEIFLKAAAALDAPQTAIQSVRRALADFDALIETHAGDRRTLDLMLASHEQSPREPAEETRRLAFEGNSAIWGIQGRVRFGSYFIAPNAEDPTLIDAVNVGGLIDARRMRPDVTVPVFMAHAYNDDGTTRTASHEPLDPGAAADDPSFLMPTFCSPGAPALVPVRSGAMVRFELPRGPVGRSATSSWVFGARIPRLGSLFRDELNRYGQHSTRLYVPVEHLLVDLFVHRRLPLAADLSAALFSQLTGESFRGVAREADRLPLRDSVIELGGRPPVVATPLLPRYSELVRWTFERVGWDASDFTCRRLVIKYPPIPTVLVLRYALPERG